MATTVDLGDIGLDENSPNADKFLRAIADNTVTVTLPTVDDSSPNMDKLLYHIYTNGVGGGGTTTIVTGKWWNGSSTPTVDNTPSANEGDFFINTTTKEYYIREASDWRKVGTLEGTNGVDGSKWYNSANGAKETIQANDGDYFLDNNNGQYFEKVSGAWVDRGSLKGLQGLQGPAGTAGSAGPQGPQGATGPKGEDGATITIGTGDPNVDIPVANQNDLYLNNQTWELYKYTNTDWISQGNIKGATGPAGPSGEKGEAGVAGPAGAIGPQGPVGASAGFGTVTATITEDGGTPSVEVTSDGANTAKNFTFTFKNIKGDPGTGTTTTGTTWHTSNGDPRSASIQSNPGDYSINSNNGDIYRNDSGTWIPIAEQTRVTYVDNSAYPFQNQWNNVGGDLGRAYYYRKGGVVYLEGAVKHPKSNPAVNTIFTLPPSYCPKTRLIFPVAAFNTSHLTTGIVAGWISIEKTGDVRYHGGPANYAFSLSGVAFTIVSNP